MLITHNFRIPIVDFLNYSLGDLHLSCLQLTPESVKYKEILQALVCGKNFETATYIQLYSANGLIHLFVVSGTHLIFLNQFFQKIIQQSKHLTKYANLINTVLLFFYCAVCKFNPPVVRSYLLILFTLLLPKSNKFGIQNTVLCSGLFCLVLNPHWITSLSLQMSWIAGISIVLCQRYAYTSSIWIHSLTFYILLMPILLVIGAPPTASISISALFTPVLEFCLFPLGILTQLLPSDNFPFIYVAKIFDSLISMLNTTLQTLNLQSNTGLQIAHEKVIYLGWLQIVLLHFCLYLHRPTPSVLNKKEIL